LRTLAFSKKMNRRKERMQFSNNRAKATAIIITVLMIASMAAMAIPAQAQEVTQHGGSPGGGYEGPTAIPTGQTATYTIQSLAFLSVSPNPVGVGQQLLVNVWTTFPSGEGKYQVGYTVTITKPNGDTQDVQLKSYVADGTSWFTMVPDTVGQWTFVFKFAGEYFPAGYWVSGQYSATRTGQFSGAIYNPSVYVSPATSNIVVITVQSDLVSSWQSPLPTDYWTRPIEPNNREWYAIGGNYPWSEAQTLGANAWKDEYYGPYITAPSTPHIVWKRQGTVGGLIGGEAYQYPVSAGFGGVGTPSLIYLGRCYQTVTKQMTVSGTNRQAFVSVAECYDLRTGQIYYDIPTADGGVTPTYISYWSPSTAGASSVVPGEIADLGLTVDLWTISGSFLYKVNPTTGAVTNITIASFTGTVFVHDGYVLSFNRTGYIPVVNDNITVNKYWRGFLINWSEAGSSSNFASRIQSNVSAILPESYRTIWQVPGGYGDYGAYDPESMIAVNQNRFIYGGYYGSSLEAFSLKTGQSLWNWTSDVNVMESCYRPTNAWCRHGRYIAEMERGYWKAWDLTNGKVLWTSEMNDVPWGEFWMYDEAAYQDVLYGVGYTGIWAINETNGKVVWHYVDPSVPFETPYTSANGTESSYSVQNIRIADGKVYVANSEHTPSLPNTRGWGLICLNVTTGEKLWKIMGTAMGPGPAADGYMAVSSSYDGYMYVLGKGQSKTTVTAPDVQVPKDTTVLIRGSVLDMSPASPNTPAVSDESMDTWMDYLHLQMPVDGIYHNETIKGVDVLLVAVDTNNNPTTIGTATTDSSGNFAIEWAPTLQSKYTITAIFSGTGSYGSSTATTALSVGPAVETPPPVEIPTPIDYTMTIIGAAVAIIIVVVLVGVAIILRKK
jgi:hypothetical protein